MAINARQPSLARDSRGCEKEAIREAEAGHLARATALLNHAASLTPDRASVYNNRAQVHRLNANIQGALEDLDKAIRISKGQGRSACQALCQRGMTFKRLRWPFELCV